ncbi:MAG: DUF6498-containing protein [Planctomycetota bacterium]
MSTKPSYGIALIALVIANVATIISYVMAWVTFNELLWSYWCQSVLIGIFNALRMSVLKDFSTEGFTSNGKRVSENAAGKFSTVIFFIIHYGFFHMVYAVFIAGQSGGIPNFMNASIWLIVVFVFFYLGSELFIVRAQIRIDSLGKPNIGSMMFLPYLRIVPMHLTIIFGGVVGSGAVIFLVLKLLADLIGQYVDERININALKKSTNQA